jgi:two-component system, chemotaxis family, chemotaxis protein CheY
LSTITKYIIVDDDAVHNLICSMTIKRTVTGSEVKSFVSPEEGLAFIKENYLHDFNPAILLLDINMPTLNAWEFLDEYERLDESIKKSLVIYVLSSSVDQRDIDRAGGNEYVKGFFSKPLSFERIQSW